jgi:RHS repeat-associated protein
MEIFAWTNSGNMAWEFIAPTSHVASLPTRTMTYEADNRLAKVNGAGVTSDPNGNLTSAPLTNSTFVTYGYDARNRLAVVGGTSSTTNIYDPAGSRVRLAYGTNNAAYVINPNSGLPQVLMRIKNGVTNYYVYGVGLMYQVTESATVTNTLTYHYDYRGSTVALTDNGGNITDRAEYSLYGTLTYRVGTNDTPFLFNGQYGVMSDPNGLLYMQARYYNPYLCRFLSQDPSGFGGGLNMYAFANGNPVSYMDPFGLGALSESGIAAASLYNAPTPEQVQIQSAMAGIANFSTLGLANLGSSLFTGKDLEGNNLNIDDAYEQTLETWVDVASLPLAVLTDGGSLDVEAVAMGTGEDVLDANVGRETTAVVNSPRQIQYGTDISQVAQQFRIAKNNWNPAGNVAVFEYADSAGNLLYSPGFAQRTIGHAEQLVGNKLINQGINPSSVTRVYTEFSPCTGPANCTAYLQQNFPNTQVLYSFTHDDAGRSAKAALFSIFK